MTGPPGGSLCADVGMNTIAHREVKAQDLEARVSNAGVVARLDL